MVRFSFFVFWLSFCTGIVLEERIFCINATLVTWAPRTYSTSLAMTEKHAIALKLPTFWTTQPEVWFAQVEAQFALNGITTDKTKYFYVLASLDQEMATRLLDLISSSAYDSKYVTLKDWLISTFGLNERERAS